MRIFVTGASGVIGRRVVPQLVAAGHQVSAAVHSPTSGARLEAFGARPVTVDLFDRASVDRSVAGHETIINLATHIPHSTAKLLLPGAWRENDRLRRLASRLLVDAAIANGATRLIQESFAPVYPDRGEDWITEATPLAPVRYNRTVLDAEQSAERFTRSGRRGIVLRFAGFYGPDSTQLGDLLQSVRRGLLPLPGDPAAYFSFVSHDDAAAAVVAALSLDAGPYNVVDNEPVTRRALGETVAALLGVKPPRRPIPRLFVKVLGSIGELMSRSQRISNRKLREAGNWRPRYPSIREGLRATLEERKAA
ncbi:MAG: NAD-dependent epimerase/dehydratase family protein [Gemmatimonadales bacterium]